MSSTNELEAAKAEAAEFKQKAARASEDLLRANREIGALRDELDASASLQKKNDRLDALNADLTRQLGAARAAAEAADRKAAGDAAKLAAADQIAAGLKALAS